MVSIERMMAVIWPLKSKTFWTWNNLKNIIISIWITAFLASIHSHITYTVTMVVRNETILNTTTGNITKIERRALQQAIRPSMKKFWKIATLLNVVFVILLPVIFVVGANILMICQLRQEHNQFISHIRNNKRATFIVIVIATTFTICQTPSAIIFLCEILWPNIGLYSEFRTAATLSNSLVVTGKTANNVLFCMWSSHFRKNLYIIISNYVPRLPEYVRQKLTPILPLNKPISSTFRKFQVHQTVNQKYNVSSERYKKNKQLFEARYSLPLLRNEHKTISSCSFTNR